MSVFRVSSVALSGAVLDVKEVNSPPVNTTSPPGTAYDPPQHNCSCVCSRDTIVSCKYHCGEFEVGVLIGYCMTMNSKRSEVVVGSCPFIPQTYDKRYITVPNNSAQLNGVLCGYAHRTGQLCGQCVNGLLLLSTPTTHSVSSVQQALTTGPSTWLCLCSLQLCSSLEL